MASDPKKLLEEALQLPQEARAALAGSLIDSLDDQVDEDSEAVWKAEIAARLAELRKGSVESIPWSKARRLILAEPDDPTPT